MTETVHGHLDWKNGGNTVNLQQIDEQQTENGIKFTLLLKQDHPVESCPSNVFISSAVLDKATNDTIIRCSDADHQNNNAKDCHIQIKGE